MNRDPRSFLRVRLIASLASLSVGLVLAVCTVRAQESGLSAPPDDSEAVRTIYEKRCVDMAGFCAEAYGLTADQKAGLERQLLDRVEPMLQNHRAAQLAAQEVTQAFDKATARLAPGERLPDDEIERIEAPLHEIESQEPLGFENILKLVEKNLPPEQAKAGRERVPKLQEEITKRTADQSRQMAESLAEAAQRVQIREGIEAHRRADAQLSPSGKPMPKAEFKPPPPPFAVVEGTHRAVLPPSVTRRVPEPKGSPALPPRSIRSPTGRSEQKAAVPKAQPAPPIDEWDKYVDSFSEKRKVTAGQRTKAQAILKDLRQRALQYRASHAEDYDRLKRVEDRAARSEEERNLNEPVNALFQELKERLDGLLTMEQRSGG